MNAIAVTSVIILGALMLMLPHNRVVIPLIAGGTFISLGQDIIIAGGHFDVLRLLIIVGWMRLVLRGEATIGRFTPIDKMLIAWVIASVVMFTLLWQTGSALVNRLGLAFNAIGLYFLFRFSIKTAADLRAIIKAIIVISVPLLLFMLYERSSGRNLFSVFGGDIPEFSYIRYGGIRCQGPFRHPILAGTFAATTLPLALSLWLHRPTPRIFPIMGAITLTGITLLSHSSGPVMSWLYGIAALAMWLARNHMKLVRRSVAVLIVGLALVMKAPVWYMIAKIGYSMGGTGWHRAYLLDQAFNHIGQWWLVGTRNTADWMPYTLFDDSADITNNYLSQGVNGGILLMIIFILLLARGFQGAGQGWRNVSESNLSDGFFIWSLGAALTAHAAAFMSVTYFDQIIIYWYLLLASISLFSLPPAHEAQQAFAPLPAEAAQDGAMEEFSMKGEGADERLHS